MHTLMVPCFFIPGMMLETRCYFQLNIVNNTVVSAHLRRPIACPRVTTASGDITTVSEVEVDVFLTDEIGVNLVFPIVP